MEKSIYPHNTITYDTGDEINWADLYPRLHTLARRLVYKYRIPCWYGQVEDVIDDVTQETARRIIERLQKAAHGEATPIDLPEQMMAAIARNYIIDLVRREHRMIHLPIDELTPTLRHDGAKCMQIEEVATENVNNAWIFLQLAREISHFPTKQRRAILIDLANRTCFDEQRTPLQAAFLVVGIDLRDYQLQLPEDSVGRTRHTSLMSLAYKRISQFNHAQ